MIHVWKKVSNPEMELEIGEFVLVKQWGSGIRVPAALIDNRRSEFNAVEVVYHGDPNKERRKVHYTRLRKRAKLSSKGVNPNIAFKEEVVCQK